MPKGMRSLTRSRPKREERQRFILYCEGRNTEPTYFDALQHYCRSAMIEIKCVGAAGVPTTIRDRAKEHQLKLKKEKRKNPSAANDTIWAVFDRDEHPNIPDVLAGCESAGVKTAYSNPCFEVWLILHHQDYHAADDRHQVQRRFNAIDPSYNPNGRKIPNCADLIQSVEIAENRADAQCERRIEEGHTLGRPCTTVYKLTRAIRKAAQAARPNSS